ncbi:MAG: hypothetical protein JO025_00285 [Verrucomicrobia bacterium]|nr:hypothetical protein [Verrucomicrobiota bacterium]
MNMMLGWHTSWGFLRSAKVSRMDEHDGSEKLGAPTVLLLSALLRAGFERLSSRRNYDFR